MGKSDVRCVTPPYCKLTWPHAKLFRAVKLMSNFRKTYILPFSLINGLDVLLRQTLQQDIFITFEVENSPKHNKVKTFDLKGSRRSLNL